MNIEWKNGFSMKVRINNGTVTLSANKEGLISLQKQLSALAEEMPGSHIHYDSGNSLEDGSAELIIEKI